MRSQITTLVRFGWLPLLAGLIAFAIPLPAGSATARLLTDSETHALRGGDCNCEYCDDADPCTEDEGGANECPQGWTTSCALLEGKCVKLVLNNFKECKQEQGGCTMNCTQSYPKQCVDMSEGSPTILDGCTGQCLENSGTCGDDFILCSDETCSS